MVEHTAGRRCPSSLTLAISVALMIIGLSTTMAHAQSHYYYFKEQRPLPLDVTRVAIFENAARGTGNRFDDPQAANRLGIVANDITSMVISGWSYLGSAAEKQTPVGIQQIVSQFIKEQSADFISPVFVGNRGGPVVITPDILVGFRPEIDALRAEAILGEMQAGVILDRNWGNMQGAYRLRHASKSGFDVLATANALAQRPEIMYAEPDVIFTGGSSFIPNDPGFLDCWGLHNTGQFGGIVDMDMDVPEAWDIITGDPSIKVVIIDTGVQQDHPDINQISGFDSTEEGPGDGGPVNACDNHGTPVAGCVTATINNDLGTVGVAPGCVSTSARTFIATMDCSGSWNSQPSWTVDSLAWAESIGARVTNNSSFYGFTSSAITNKYAETRRAGMVHFSVASNDSIPVVTYPGNLPSVNAVAALDPDGTLTDFSNWGDGLAFSAPGIDVLTTDRTGFDGWVSGDFVFAAGTSFASPYSAGIAALILSLNPALNACEVEHIMEQSSVDLGDPGYDTTYGWGFVNAREALLYVQNLGGGGVPECQCAVPASAVENPSMGDIGFGVAPRFLSFNAGEPGRIHAIRVTFPDPMPSPYGAASGSQMWVGPPSRRCENSASGGPAPNDTPPDYGCDPAPGLPQRWYMASTLQCQPHFIDWHGRCLLGACEGGMRDGISCGSDSDCIGPLYVFHNGIVPSKATPTTYEVQLVHEFCEISNEASFSDPLDVTTSRWGDSVLSCADDPCGPPNGSVDIVTDVVAVLRKFSNLPGAPIKARCDLVPATPNHVVDFSDVLSAVFGFQGLTYDLAGVVTCP